MSGTLFLISVIANMDTELSRVPLRRAPALVASWCMHWVFWPVITWGGFLLWMPLGIALTIVSGVWLLALTYLAVRYHRVRLILRKTEAVSVGFFQTRRFSRAEISSVMSSNTAPTLAFVILAPQLTGRSIYWTPAIIRGSGGEPFWLDSMFGPHQYVEESVRTIRTWIDQ